MKIETKIAKNGAINFYNAETGKRVAEASVVEDAIENGGTYYTAKTLRYSGNFADKNFASPITAYKWLARTSDGSMEIVRCDRVNGKSTYTTIYQIGCDGGDELIESAELGAHLKEIRGTSGAFTEEERREEQITLRMKSDNLSREQAEELVDYIRANREHYNSEVRNTVKTMLDNFKKINNPEPAVEETAIVETATVEDKDELPSGYITVNSGAEAWAIVGKHFPKDNLEFYRAGKGFNNEDTFCYTLDEIIYVHATCTPDNKRVECIEIVNTYEESESERNILTVYINHDAATESAMEDAKTTEVDKDATADSLTRAMTIALEHYQDFCRVGNLTAATNELSLYNICRKAMTELWKERTTV